MEKVAVELNTRGVKLVHLTGSSVWLIDSVCKDKLNVFFVKGTSGAGYCFRARSSDAVQPGKYT